MNANAHDLFWSWVCPHHCGSGHRQQAAILTGEQLPHLIITEAGVTHPTSGHDLHVVIEAVVTQQFAKASQSRRRHSYPPPYTASQSHRPPHSRRAHSPGCQSRGQSIHRTADQRPIDDRRTQVGQHRAVVKARALALLGVAALLAVVEQRTGEVSVCRSGRQPTTAASCRKSSVR